jgi:hypothetical protein
MLKSKMNNIWLSTALFSKGYDELILPGAVDNYQ